MQITTRDHDAVAIAPPVEATLVSPREPFGGQGTTWPVGTAVTVEGLNGVKLVSLIVRLPNDDLVPVPPEMVANDPAIAQEILALRDGSAVSQQANAS